MSTNNNNYEECEPELKSLSLSLLFLSYTCTPSPANLKFVHIHSELHIYLFKQRFAEAETECVLVEDGTCHEGAHAAQQLLVFLQHKPWQGKREILGENGARLKTAEDRNKERRQVWWGREYFTYLCITVSC